MSDPDGIFSAHRPARLAGGFRGQPAVHCPDCSWAQAVDEDLHGDYEGLLFSWHTEHPDEAVDHLAPGLPAGPLAVPGYVRWDQEYGRAVIGDTRTRATVLFNHECLAIFQSVATTGGLDHAATTNARRLGISPGTARPDIVLIATNLYRKGLLRTAQ
ncbi:hypothetical protein PZB75_30165 [Streptomyces sp. AM 4-1-1]|uniref:hypothetical protein n=1 Tax=Streptomyces sp. AM 4-1-1 TaxID=3028710 RepID=UPI0023B94F8B|nr:hypothetical protein [Streptomyces sp. AM 4-1-1]WEH37256.1 hypothetical protein PZB75_30165 [Streptomyces sp. AM 4-1-1]